MPDPNTTAPPAGCTCDPRPRRAPSFAGCVLHDPAMRTAARLADDLDELHTLRAHVRATYHRPGGGGTDQLLHDATAGAGS